VQAATRSKVVEFLNVHTAYELIPESGKVVVIDCDYPVRHAFHALHKQSISSAPLWDAAEQAVVGMISASDFIETLRKLRAAAGSGGGALSDAEMDAHTIRAMREAAAADDAPPRPLVFCREHETFSTVRRASAVRQRLPPDTYACVHPQPVYLPVHVAGSAQACARIHSQRGAAGVQVVRTLVDNRCSMAPILSCDPTRSSDLPTVLHIATLSGVLACLMRHFRASLASLPLLQQPLASMPIGSWSPDSPIGQTGQAGPSAEVRTLRGHSVHVMPAPQTGCAGRNGTLRTALRPRCARHALTRHRRRRAAQSRSTSRRSTRCNPTRR
jgi:5'-AMP-activated protein kinase, regulatory gamma subunit